MSSSPELSVLLGNEAIRQAIISKLTEGEYLPTPIVFYY